MNPLSPKVLVVDDDLTNRMILSSIVEQLGCSVVLATDGVEAVRLFESEAPDLVLMDVIMPNMDGYEATRRIKNTEHGRFTPVIVVTGLQDPEEIQRGIAAGADDFLHKPFNPIVIQSKMRAMLRIRELNDTVRTQNQELQVFRQQRIQEEAVAEKIFDSIVHFGASDVPNVRSHIAPSTVFNGDLLLMAFRSTGELHVLVGDFTGHGLSAAIGAVPVSDMFCTMTSNGFSIGDIAAALNDRLKRMLPPNIFFAACLISVDAIEKRMTVWNGGLPDVLVARPDNTIRARTKSHHVPIGIHSSTDFKRETETIDLVEGDLIYACTDGLIDSPIAAGGRFGSVGYEACFDAELLPMRPFDCVLETIREISGDGPRDDTTLIEIQVTKALARAGADPNDAKALRIPSPWSMSFDFNRATLKNFDPIPFLLRGLVEVQGLARHKERLYTVLSELFNNALDHGVLGLDSRLKSSATGFSEYLAERARRLANGGEGYVRIWFKHVPSGEGGRLRIRVEDSGPGFDFRSSGNGSASEGALNGRGIPLLRSLCDSIEYRGRGNEVEAVLEWE